MSDREGEEEEWELIDVFCGGGLFSFAAQAAGMRVIKGYDHDLDACRAFRRNHPDATCKRLTIGPDRAIAWPDPRPKLHIHLSPPCTELSAAKTRGARTERGADLLEWSIVQMVEQGHQSWSVENVAGRRVRVVVDALERRFPAQVASGMFNAADFGTPQDRTRMIVGPPWLIHALSHAPRTAKRTVLEAFREEGFEPRGDFFKNTSISREGSNVRSVHETAFTVCACRSLAWCKPDGGTPTIGMKPRESRILMGMPPSYKLSGQNGIDQKVLGNGMSFHLSKTIAMAAMGTLVVPDVDSIPMKLTGLKRRLEAAEEAIAELRRRVADVER